MPYTTYNVSIWPNRWLVTIIWSLAQFNCLIAAHTKKCSIWHREKVRLNLINSSKLTCYVVRETIREIPKPPIYYLRTRVKWEKLMNFQTRSISIYTDFSNNTVIQPAWSIIYVCMKIMYKPTAHFMQTRSAIPLKSPRMQTVRS